MKTPVTPSANTSYRAPLTIAGLSILVYIHTLRNGFVNYDDVDARILKNPFLNTPWDWGFLGRAFSQATAGYYDPVYVLSYVIDYQLWGMNPAGFHLGNLVLHTLNALLVFYLVQRMTQQRALAWVTALLFAVHPAHVEAVSWATSRKETLSLFFALASMWVYWRGLGTGARRYILHAGASILLLLLGMMTKPTVAVAPGMILFAELLLGPRPFRWRRIAVFQAVAWAMVLAFVALTFSMTVGIAVKETIHFTPAQHVTLFFELYAYFIKILLFPVNLNALYLVEVRDWFAPMTVAVIIPGLLFLVGWLFVELKRAILSEERARRYGPILWGAVVFFAGLLPYTNILPRTIYLADRYTYLPSVGFCLIAAWGLLRIPAGRARLAAIAGLILIYGALTVDRVPVWRDSVTLWKDVMRKTNMDPDEQHLLMARAYGFEGQWEQALQEYRQMNLAGRRDPQLWIQVARVHSTLGQYDEARRIFEKLDRACPGYPVPLIRIIALDIAADRFGRARDRLQRAAGRFTGEERKWIEEAIRDKQQGRAEQVWRGFQRLEHSIEQRIAGREAELLRQCREGLTP